VRANKHGVRIWFAQLKPGETLTLSRGTPKSVTREQELKSMLRQMWFGFRFQAMTAFPAMNPKHMFICYGNVYRIRPHELQILTLIYFQHFQEVRNTAWFIAVPNLEHKSMIDG
jgi:hypothetical protein